MRMVDLYYAAGFLEGEGSFVVRERFDPSITAGQVQLEPLERLQELFGGNIYPCKLAKNGRQPSHVWNLNGSRAIGLMLTLFPMMSTRRQSQIANAVNGWRSRTKTNTCLDDAGSLALMRRVCAGESVYHVAKSARVHGKTLSDWLHGKQRQHLLVQLRNEVSPDVLEAIHRRRWEYIPEETIIDMMRDAAKRHRSGESWDRIAVSFGVTSGTVTRWMNGQTHSHLLARLQQEDSPAKEVLDG